MTLTAGPPKYLLMADNVTPTRPRPDSEAAKGDPSPNTAADSPVGANSANLRRVLKAKTVLLDPFRCVNGSRVRPVGKLAVTRLVESLEKYGWIGLSAPVIHYQAERVDLQQYFRMEKRLSEAEALKKTDEALADGGWSAIVEGNHRIQAVRQLAQSDHAETRNLWRKFLVPSVLSTDSSRTYVESFAIALNQIQATHEEQSYADELTVYKRFLDSSCSGRNTVACAAAARAFMAASASFSTNTKSGRSKKLTTVTQDMTKARELSYGALRLASDLASSKENRKSLLNHNNVKFAWKDLLDEDQINLVRRMDYVTTKRKMPSKQESIELKTGLLAVKGEVEKVLTFFKYNSPSDAPIQISSVLRRALIDNRLDKDALQNEPSSQPCEALMTLVKEHDPTRYAHAVASDQAQRNAIVARLQERDREREMEGAQVDQAPATQAPATPVPKNGAPVELEPGKSTPAESDSNRTPSRVDDGIAGPKETREDDPGPSQEDPCAPAPVAAAAVPSCPSPGEQRRRIFEEYGITVVNSNFQHFHSTSSLFVDTVQQKVDLVLTDVPYSGMNTRSVSSENLLTTPELVALLTLIGASLKDSGNAIVFC